MSLTDFLLMIHLVTTMVWLGGSVLGLLMSTRMKDTDPAHRLGFAKAMQMTSRRVFMPAAILVLVFGTWLVADSDLYDFDQAWISIGFGVVIIAAAMGPAFFRPAIAKAIAATESGDSTATGAAMARVGTVLQVSVALQFIAVWAMVTKPGL